MNGNIWWYNFNSQAVGIDSWKCHQRHPQVFRFNFCLFVNMSHLYKLRHRKNDLKNVRKFISQERHIRILIWSVYNLSLFQLTFQMRIRFILKIWFSRKSKLLIGEKNNVNFHLCSSVKFWRWKMFSKSLETSILNY